MVNMAISNVGKAALTDLHTHILHGIDDGAEDLEAALEMLRLQKTNGVERVVLTPHFYPLREELQSFLERRQRAYEELIPSWDGEIMPQMKLGAEVHYSPSIVECDLRSLTVGQGNYMLLELSDTVFPTHIEEVLKIVKEQGVTPILAHVERCSYFREEPRRLVHLVEQGALAQTSAKALATPQRRKFAEICLQKNVAHIIASDIHHKGESETCLGAVAEKVNEEILTQAEVFARAVWDNTQPPDFQANPIKRKLFGYA